MTEKEWMTIPIDCPTLDQVRTSAFQLLLFAQQCEDEGKSKLACKEFRMAHAYVRKALKRIDEE